MPSLRLILMLVVLVAVSIPAATKASGTPDFTLSLNPSLATYQYGPGARTNFTLTSVNGFQGVVNMNYFWLNGSSDIFVGLVNPYLQVGGTFTDQIKVVSPPISIGCCGILQVTATSGSLSHTANFTIDVPPGPDFAITVAPKAVDAPQGVLATANVTVTNTDTFNGTIFFIGGVSPGILSGFSFSTTSVNLGPGASGSSLLEANTTAATPGIYNFTLRAYDLGHSHTAQLTMIVLQQSAGFIIIQITSPVILHPGSSSAVTTNLTSIDNFFGNVTLTVSPDSTDLTTGWTTQTLELQPNSTISTNVALTASNSILPGVYSVVLNAFCNGVIHFTSIIIVVPFPPSFTMILAPPDLTIQPGHSANATITLDGISNFNGTINLTIQPLGGGPITNLTLKTTTLTYSSSTSTITLTISLPPDTPPGTKYTTMINATDGTTTHQAKTVVTAVAPPGGPPSSNAGLSTIYIITGLIATAAATSLAVLAITRRHKTPN